jgi:pyrroline-5-carboxylate reductase
MANRENDIHVGIIGAGTMGEAFIAALIRSGVAASSIKVVVRRKERGDELHKKYSVIIDELATVTSTVDVLILGIKPQGLAELLPEIQPHLQSDTLVISLLAGKTLSGIAQGLGGHTAIARVMPNTPTLIGQGMAGYSLISTSIPPHSSRCNWKGARDSRRFTERSYWNKWFWPCLLLQICGGDD